HGTRRADVRLLPKRCAASAWSARSAERTVPAETPMIRRQARRYNDDSDRSVPHRVDGSFHIRGTALHALAATLCHQQAVRTTTRDVCGPRDIRRCSDQTL